MKNSGDKDATLLANSGDSAGAVTKSGMETEPFLAEAALTKARGVLQLTWRRMTLLKPSLRTPVMKWWKMLC